MVEPSGRSRESRATPSAEEEEEALRGSLVVATARWCVELDEEEGEALLANVANDVEAEVMWDVDEGPERGGDRGGDTMPSSSGSSLMSAEERGRWWKDEEENSDDDAVDDDDDDE
jgi:hypothetical protein